MLRIGPGGKGVISGDSFGLNCRCCSRSSGLNARYQIENNRLHILQGRWKASFQFKEEFYHINICY